MNPSSPSTADRAAGAILGALIGDALGLGPHWYYDLDELRRRYGPWIDGYTDPMPGHYHEGMKAGELSQTGLILEGLLRSVVERGGYDEADWTTRMDADLFARIDGRPRSGPGGYTNQSIREAYHKRVREGRPWGEIAGPADTTEAAERLVILAARYAADPGAAAQHTLSNCVLTQNDPLVASLSVGFGCVVSALVRGEKMDENISDPLMDLVHDDVLPFGHVTGRSFAPPGSNGAPGIHLPEGHFPSPDSLLLPGYCAQAAHEPGITIEPAWKVAIVYMLPCAAYGPLPAAYYLAARFAGEFELPVLHALNGGGQNMSRACLTGALAGAQVGLSGIPARFIDGLGRGRELAELARRVGEAAVG